MATGKFRHGWNFLITAIALFVILVVVNLFSYRHFFRIDLTRGKDHTITKTTRDLIGDLEDIINIRVYLSKNLPAALLPFEHQLRDRLSEYESYGKGKLRVRFEAPAADDRQTRQQLMMMGIRPRMFGEITGDKRTQIAVYNAVVVQYSNKREVIPDLIEQLSGGVGLISDFEYLLTSKIARVQRTGKPVVGWLTNAPDIKFDENFKTLKERVGREWDIHSINFDEPRRIPADIKVLVLISPRDFSDEHLFELDQYLMRGGRILAMVDTYDASQETRTLTHRPTNFTRFLQHYGIRVNDQVVRDDRYPAHTQFGLRFWDIYPLWVHFPRTGMNQADRAVAGLNKLTYPWPQSLDKVTTIPENVTYVPLVWSSPYSSVRTEKSIPLVSLPRPKSLTRSTSRTVVALLTGRFPSYFPEGTPYPVDEGTTTPRTGRTREEDRMFESADTRILVVGNSLFLRERFVNGYWRYPFNMNNNVGFFLNSLESLGYGTTLGQIRARERIMHPIRREILSKKHDGTRKAYKFFGTFAMPVLVVLGGIVYNTVRRNRRLLLADRLLKP